MNRTSPFTHFLSQNISNMRQRIVTMLVAVLAMLPVFANDHIGVGNSSYRIIDNEAYYIGEYDVIQPVVIVPEKIECNGRQYTVVGFDDDDKKFDWPYRTKCEYVEEFYLPSTIRHTSHNRSVLREGYPNLKTIHIESGGDLAAQDGVLYTSDMKTLVFVPSKYTGVLTVPESVTTLEEQCCKEADISGVILPEDLQSIANGAFYKAGIVDVTLPGNLQLIGDNAFYGTNIASVTFPESLRSIGNNAFCGTNISRLVIPDNIVSLGKLCIAKLEYLSLGNSITSISANLLYGCESLREVYIPASVTFISGGAFDPCSSSVSLIVDEGNPNYSVVDGALYNKGVTELLFVPKCVQQYTAPKTLTAIASGVFIGRSNLKSLDLSSSNVSTIGGKAFYDCGNLQYINLGNKLTTLCFKAFAFSEYRSTRPPRVIVLPDALQELSDNVFANNVIGSISGGNGLKTIAGGAFRGCEFRGTQELFVPYSVEKIGGGAYADIKCDKNLFTKIYIGDKVTQIESKAFDITQSVLGLYCAATTPPQCSQTAFSDGLYAVTTLMVPDVEAYEKVFPWYKFMKSSYHDFSGVEEVADGGEEVSVSCVGGELRVECADGTAVTVWSADGREAFSGTGSCTVALPRGIYIVRAGSSTCKVIL